MARPAPDDPLSHKLRAAFRDALDEPLPPDLLVLVARLDDDDGRRDRGPRRPVRPMATAGA